MNIKQENSENIKSLEAKIERLTQKLQNKDKQLEETQKLLKQREELAFLGEASKVVFHDLANYLYGIEMSSSASLECCQYLEKMFSEARFWLGEETFSDFFTDNPYQEKILPNLRNCLLDIQEKVEIITKLHRHADIYINSEQEEGQEIKYQELDFTNTNFNEVVADCLDLACKYGEFKKQQKGENKIKLNLETDYDLSIDEYFLPVEEIRRILINLIDNAYYAVYEKTKEEEENYLPTIFIKTSLIDEAIKIIIKDNGKGIKDEIKGRTHFGIFNPFMTTKPAGEGTGLGLYIVVQLLRKIKNGVREELKEKVDIKLKSKENKYTQFTLLFPIIQPEN